MRDFDSFQVAKDEVTMKYHGIIYNAIIIFCQGERKKQSSRGNQIDR